MSPDTAFEWLSWLALVLGCAGMWLARGWVNRAADVLAEANRIYAEAISERQVTLAALEEFTREPEPGAGDAPSNTPES